MNVDDLVIEALKMPSNKVRVTGTITGFDGTGTAIFVLAEDGRQLLAFVDPNNPTKSGDQVSFRIDNLRAKDMRKEIPA
jgi:hypothetical protein